MLSYPPSTRATIGRVSATTRGSGYISGRAFAADPARRAHQLETGLMGESSPALTSLDSRQKRPKGRHLRWNSRKVNIMSPDQLVYTVPEAAKLLRISPAHAYALVSSGELPNLRLGRRILIPAGAWRASSPKVLPSRKQAPPS